MSILSDKTIRSLCEHPMAYVIYCIQVPGAGLKEVKEPVYFPTNWERLSHRELFDLAWPEGRAIAQKRGAVGTVQVMMSDFATPVMENTMIEPYEPQQVRERDKPIPDGSDGVKLVMGSEKIVSYGTSSYGYDIRCGREFKVFTNTYSAIVDPKNFDEKAFVDVVGDKCIIPPNSFALARTMEYFRIPRNVLTVCLGKSTYARCGIIVNVTPFEPEWEGYVTLEFSNTTPLPAVIYAGEGCAQVLFFEGDEPCEVSYKDRGGKYQGQAALPVTPKV